MGAKAEFTIGVKSLEYVDFYSMTCGGFYKLKNDDGERIFIRLDNFTDCLLYITGDEGITHADFEDYVNELFEPVSSDFVVSLFNT